MHCGEFRLLVALIPAEGLSSGNGLVYVSGKAPAGTQMVGRRRAGRMRRSNKRLFLDEVELGRKRGLQLRCGRPKKLHRATLLRKPVSLLLGNVVSCVVLQTLTLTLTLRNRLQPHVFFSRQHSPNPPLQDLLLLYPSYQFVIFTGFRYLFVNRSSYERSSI